MMIGRFRVWSLLGALLLGLPAWADEAPEADVAGVPAPAPRLGWIDEARVAASGDGSEWLLHGATWNEQRFSPLDQIHRRNVGELGLAWSQATGTSRGLEATPIVVDGVMFATTSWSRVLALDAATGEVLWRYDPKVPGWKARHACCDVVNRGVAVWKGRVFVGTIDGRLIALDAATGEPIWEVLTVDPERPYTITGAPRVVKGRIVIGNGGADLGVRGYVSAYEPEDGALVWRFYTVPASVEGPHEHPELELAARTWSPDSVFESGLGGTVWDSLAYDPELDLLYVGVGNSSIYDPQKRSPGGGDNLFLASILALRPDTGRLVWHYQTTPGEAWDYTATQHMILAELELGGKHRKVLMQAPKNGFFYVLDRATGELLKADKYVFVSWASHVDLATGRPAVRSEARWSQQMALVAPAVVGGHSWHPMSFSPRTGLVYVPAIELTYAFRPDPSYRYRRGRWNTAEDTPGLAAEVEGYEDMNLSPCSPTRLLAWDPVTGQERWSVPFSEAVSAGVLSTAGDLVFYGGADRFQAFDARTGVRLWADDVGTGIMAPAVTYRVAGEQYVAVLAGVGGSLGGHFVRLADRNEGRILAWKLGGKAAVPEPAPRPAGVVQAPRLELETHTVARGRELYHEYCHFCHGMGAKASGLYPDLRFSSRQTHDQWNDIVLGGIRSAQGMASFADVVDAADAAALHAYVVSRALHEPNLPQRLASWFARNACIPARWLAD